MKKRQLANQQKQMSNDRAAAGRGSSQPASMTSRNGAAMEGISADKIATEQFLFRERWPLEKSGAIPAQVFYLEGIAYLRSRNRTRGIEALELCLFIDKDHELAHYNLAVALFVSGRLEKAKEHLDVAVAGGIVPDETFAADVERFLLASREPN